MPEGFDKSENEAREMINEKATTVVASDNGLLMGVLDV